MAHVIEDLSGDRRRLDERIEGLSGEIETLARQDSGCERLMSVPDIGPIISSAMVAAIANARCQLVHQPGSRNRERAEARRPEIRALVRIDAGGERRRSQRVVSHKGASNPLPFLLHAKEVAMKSLRMTLAALAAVTAIGVTGAAMADHRYHHYGYYYSPYNGPGPYYYNPYYDSPGFDFRLDIR
jgi:hypothetical protein